MAIKIVMPKLGMVMTEGTITKLSKVVGDVVTKGEVVAEIETEKINYDLEATGSGLFHPMVAEGAVVPVDGLIGYLLAEGEDVPEPEVQPPADAVVRERPARRASSATRSQGAEVRSTPGARRLAAKLGVDIAEVTPTGPGGRVVESDVRAQTEQGNDDVGPVLLPNTPQPSQVVPIVGMRKGIADHMRNSLATTAQLSFLLDVDVTEAQRLRKEVSNVSDTTVTMANVLMKACAKTLKRHPEHNTILSDGRVLYFNEVNIGFAVALKEGLIVPVIKNVDVKSIFELSKETDELAAKARDGKLLPDDVGGGTFTVSVLGSVDGFTPILNAGQNAILGVGRSMEKPVVVRGEVVVREMMTISMTVDHQVIDGAVAASFLRRLQQTLGRPADLLK